MRLHVQEWGEPSAPAVICLHGVTGHGRSGWSPPWSTDVHVRDALETASALGIEEADWVAFSFGCRVLAALAACAPERVRRACLLDPAIELPAEVCADAAADEHRDASFATEEEAIADRLAAGTLFSTPRELLEEDMGEHLVRGADGRLRPRYSRAAAIVAWSDMAAPAPPVSDVPTLIVLGDRSWVDGAAQVPRHRELLGDRLHEVTLAAGHSVLWDALEPTGRAVREFLTRSPC